MQRIQQTFAVIIIAITVIKVLVKCEVLLRTCGCVMYPDVVLTEEIDCQAVFDTDI